MDLTLRTRTASQTKTLPVPLTLLASRPRIPLISNPLAPIHAHLRYPFRYGRPVDDDEHSERGLWLKERWCRF